IGGLRNRRIIESFIFQKLICRIILVGHWSHRSEGDFNLADFFAVDFCRGCATDQRPIKAAFLADLLIRAATILDWNLNAQDEVTGVQRIMCGGILPRLCIELGDGEPRFLAIALDDYRSIQSSESD